MVSWQTLFVAGCFFSAVLVLAPVPAVFRNRSNPGGRGLLVFIFAASLFSLSVGLLWSPTGPVGTFVGRNLSVLGGTALAVGWLLAMGEYAGRLSLSHRVLVLSAVYLAVFQSVAWTNPFHGLLDPPLVDAPTLVAAPTGTFFVLYYVSVLTLGVVGWLLVVAEALGSRGTRRRQSLALTAGFLPPVAANVMFTLGLTEFNLTPIGFVLTALFVTWALLRADFLDIVPVGRRRAVQSMGDPVITVDTSGRVLDSNPPARALAGIDTDEPVSIATFFDRLPALVDAVEDGRMGTVEVTVDGQRRYFDVNRTPIHGPQDQRRGSVIVLREITEQKRREHDLDLLRQIQSRVLRHNIRNELSVIKSHNEELAATLDGSLREHAEVTLERAETLSAVSEKTRAVERLIDTDWKSKPIDLGTFLSELTERISNEFPEVTVELDCPENCVVETVGPVRLLLENVVENAAEHNDSTDPFVRLTVTETDSATTIEVVDNGPGIPEHELTVRERGGETQLEHGRGVGLWIVHWIVERSSITVSFDIDRDGTAVTVTLPHEYSDKASSGSPVG